MKSEAILFPALFALTASADEAATLEARQSSCRDVHVFLAKGNNEPFPGRQGVLAAAICDGLSSCDYEDIQMNNMLEDEYCGAVAQGQANGVQQITDYSERCPDSKLVLSGYSQGAHVIGDILGGGGGVFFQDCVQPPGPRLSANTEPGSKIVAALMFGSTRHTSNQPYNVLSGASGQGLFPRNAQQLANMRAYGNRLQDWCAGTDPICAGGDVVEDHLNYFQVHTQRAADWVQEMVAAAGGDEPESSAPAPTTTTTTTRSLSTLRPSSTTTTTTTTTSADEEEETTSSAPETTSSAEEDEASTTAASSDEPSTTAASTTTTQTRASPSTTGPDDSENTSSASEDGNADGAEDDGSSAASFSLNMTLLVGISALVAFMGM
ncbi:Alpha/Beta hydrolase protein [Stachybotrys elegans]|uniref:Cutinase n=1 Tax=Stachybotrys elegans TaxID=80388 RepID=A0A8K0SY13_9HYPO|nr:Alpha/Beta hydrolase protein [Stachybotrys elegans]